MTLCAIVPILIGWTDIGRVLAPKKRIVVLISGRGSNMLAIADAIKKGQIAGQIVCVISDRSHASGLQAAKEQGISTDVVDAASHSHQASFETALLDRLTTYRPDLILLAGFMRILSASFVNRFERKILNIHPSLLPAYKGLDTHQRVLAAKEAEHGCSVHFVTAELDGGEIIEQKKVKVQAHDTPKTLAARVLEQEHILYPKVVAALCAEN